jgi:hypothetical protein
MFFQKKLTSVVMILLLAAISSGCFHHHRMLKQCCGVKVINQKLATAGGVTSSDTPGFPVTIDAAGSYILVGNLTVPDENTTAIEVKADDVTINLNGFAITGPVACTGIPPQCNASGSGNGIFSQNKNITVSNGTIRGMGQDGINLSRSSHIENVQAISNSNNGIFSGDSSILINNVALHNGNRGIAFAPGGTVTGNVANKNNIGINGGSSSVVTGNTANNNGSDGIVVGDGVTVTNNIARSNGKRGIVAGVGSMLLQNTVRNNIDFGLLCSTLGTPPSKAGYAGNVLTGNNGGDANQQVSVCIETGTNLCGTDTNCP